MPELPEVETIRQGLLPLIGSTITKAEVFRERSVRMHDGGAETFPKDIHSFSITAAVRRGKFLWLMLNGDVALLIHLGMSGQLRYWDNQPEPHPHLRVRFNLQLPDGAATGLDFIDQRTFGHLAIVGLVPTLDGKAGGEGSPAPIIPKPAAHIARDVLDPNLNLKSVTAKIQTKNTEIKRVLLDQTVLSGIGNIYADEALWQAKIHPQTIAASLSTRQINKLIKASQEIIAKSLIAGGTSFDALYVNVNGESGTNSDNLNVYSRENEPCPRCGRPIVRITFMNRSSHICKNCQR
jgi:formamidopyrimidine-DNA glycosylase